MYFIKVMGCTYSGVYQNFWIYVKVVIVGCTNLLMARIKS